MAESRERAKLAVLVSLTGSLHPEIDASYAAKYTSSHPFQNITRLMSCVHWPCDRFKNKSPRMSEPQCCILDPKARQPNTAHQLRYVMLLVSASTELSKSWKGVGSWRRRVWVVLSMSSCKSPYEIIASKRTSHSFIVEKKTPWNK